MKIVAINVLLKIHAQMHAHSPDNIVRRFYLEPTWLQLLHQQQSKKEDQFIYNKALLTRIHTVVTVVTSISNHVWRRTERKS
jgi:hypothetical protein